MANTMSSKDRNLGSNPSSGTTPSALQSVSMRRMLLYIRKRLESSFESSIENGFDSTVETIITSNLEEMSARHIINDFKLQRDNDIFKVNVKPTMPANWINIDFVTDYYDEHLIRHFVGKKPEQRGFIPDKSHAKNYRTFGIVGLDTNNIICDPAQPDSRAFYVVSNTVNGDYILYDGSYRYFLMENSAIEVKYEYTTSDMKILDKSIERFINKN